MPRTVAASQTRPLPVEHGVVVVGLGVPQNLVAPIGRRRGRLDRAGVARSERNRHARIGHRHLEVRHLVGLRVEHRHVVGRIFRRAVERTVGVDRRIAPIRRDQIVQILVGRRPVPGGDDEIALDAGRARRLVLRQFALGDAVGPVAEILVRRAAELTGDAVGHHLAGLAGGDAALPCLGAGVELAELRRDRARGLLAELMTTDAIGVVHLPDPVFARDVLRDVGRAAEILGRRKLHHRVPVDRRVVVRGRGRARRSDRRQIELLAGLGAHLRRVDEPIAAHPDLIVCGRQVGDDVAALVVGDDALGVAGRQIGGFRDHPDAGFRPLRAAHHAADVVGVDRNRAGRRGRLRLRLRVQRRRHARRQRGDADRGHGRKQNLARAHR